MRRSRAIAPTGDQRAIRSTFRIGSRSCKAAQTGSREPPWFSPEMSTYERVANALFADADPALAVPAAAVLERQVGSPVTGGCCLWRFAAAEWALQEGRVATARRSVTDMERYPKSARGREPRLGEVRV